MPKKYQVINVSTGRVVEESDDLEWLKGQVEKFGRKYGDIYAISEIIAVSATKREWVK